MNSPGTELKTKTMADFRPFSAWRYDPKKVNMNQVIAPPYDVISPDEQTALYERSPYNCVRLILNKIEASDHDGENRYSRARDFFQDWQKDKTLIQDSQPCFYFYRQEFTDPVSGKRQERSALLGKLKLEPFEKNIVIPHEKTLSKPREDRRKLLEATQTNFSPVFGLYEDPSGDVAEISLNVSKERPLFEAVDDQKVRHILWGLSDDKLNQRIHEILSSRKIYIADGHHRYQTALEYAKNKRQSDSLAADVEVPLDFVLMALVEFHDPGMVLLPTHRMILPFPGFETEKALEVLKNDFKIEAVPVEKLDGVLQNSKENKASFGLVLDNQQSFLITLKDIAQAKEKMPAGKPDVWYALDVNVLSYLRFDRLWNLSESKWESYLRFTRYAEEAIESVKDRKSKAAILLKAPQVEILREMGKVGELMPQKSTYFYPKLASGLIFYSHNK